MRFLRYVLVCFSVASISTRRRAPFRTLPYKQNQRSSSKVSLSETTNLIFPPVMSVRCQVRNRSRVLFNARRSLVHVHVFCRVHARLFIAVCISGPETSYSAASSVVSLRERTLRNVSTRRRSCGYTLTCCVLGAQRSGYGRRVPWCSHLLAAESLTRATKPIFRKRAVTSARLSVSSVHSTGHLAFVEYPQGKR